MSHEAQGSQRQEHAAERPLLDLQPLPHDPVPQPHDLLPLLHDPVPLPHDLQPLPHDPLPLQPTVENGRAPCR